MLHAGKEKLGPLDVLNDVLEELQGSELDHVLEFENKMSRLLLTTSIILSIIGPISYSGPSRQVGFISLQSRYMLSLLRSHL